jgi:hypothetical protein
MLINFNISLCMGGYFIRRLTVHLFWLCLRKGYWNGVQDKGEDKHKKPELL